MALTKIQQPLLPPEVIFATNWVLTTGVNLTSLDTFALSGNNPVKFTFTPSVPTSAFALTGIPISTNPSNYRVDIDGVLQEPGTDYYISGSNIIFTVPVSSDEKVVVVANRILGSYELPIEYTITPIVYKFTTLTTTSAFTLTGSNLSTSAGNYRVDINGVLQEPNTDYYLSGSRIIFTTPISAGEKVVVVGNQPVGTFDPSFSPVIATGTTTPRTLQNRFADVINVKDFGAVGDGVTDDTAAIQAALTYAQSKGYDVLIPNGAFVITSVLTAYVPVRIQGLLKCGYDPSVAGIRLAAQPIKISNYMYMYSNGSFDPNSATIGTAALSGAIYDWFAHYPGFVTIDLEGWRVFVDREISIDANLVFGGGAGDFNERRFICNGKIQALSAGNFALSSVPLSSKNIFRLTTSNPAVTPRVSYLKFDRLSFDLNGAANAVVCESPYFNIHFVNCFFRNPLNFSLKFDAPALSSASDVLVDSCSFIGNVSSPPAYGVYYTGNDLQFNNNIVAYHKNNLAIVAKPGYGAGIMVIDANHFYIDAASSTRRDPNILLQDCAHTNITNNYIDHGPVLYKQVNLPNCTDHTLLGNFFLYFITTEPPVSGWGNKFSFVEIEASNSSAAIQRMNIISNRFINFESAETISTPFSANFIPSITGAHVENTIRLNQFFFTTFMGTEMPATATFTNTSSVSVVPPTWNSPFQLPIKKIKTYIPYFTSNPGGTWMSGTAPNFVINTGNNVTGTIDLLLTTSPSIHY